MEAQMLSETAEKRSMGSLEALPTAGIVAYC
jgi:hypothetical protein